METKLTKVIIAGKEFFVTDKEAQALIESLTKRVEELENTPCQLSWIEV